ncbi:MAG TPA: ATP-binding protein [Anaeromyxobacteraceae bacterium]|nr:ATP-binding protein [Anaeromyxobacteraceae bacterium]
MTLRLKLFVLVAGLIVFSTAGVTAVALWREVERGQELLAREGVALASTAATAAAHWLGDEGLQPGADQAFPVILGRLLGSTAIDRAWIVDRGGKVLSCTSRTGGACPEGVPPTEFRTAAFPMQALVRLVRPEGIVASSPIIRSGAVVGAVRIEYAHEEVVGTARDLAWGASLVGIAWVILGDALAISFLRRITRPLDELAVAAETLAEERGVRLPEPEERELADLVRAFNHMSERLDARRDENERLIAELEERVRKKTRDVLRADRMATLGGIAAGFAHELGNSLNVIRGFASVATRELPADHPNRPDVEAIRREVTRAASLIERFLVFARARTTHAQVQEIGHILKEVVEVVGPAAAQARVERHLDVPVGMPEIRTDAELLRQAVLNLCVNAIQAMQEAGKGGDLTVRARPEAGGVVIEVSDNGPGMEPETVKHAFEPFFTTKASGTGLGLAIVRQAAEAHGGQVEVASERGKGATFRIRIPPAPEQEA